jgi:hypothetical protein
MYRARSDSAIARSASILARNSARRAFTSSRRNCTRSIPSTRQAPQPQSATARRGWRIHPAIVARWAFPGKLERLPHLSWRHVTLPRNWPADSHVVCMTRSSMRRRQSINPYAIGDRVVIQRGPLAGLTGTVVSRDVSGRLTIEFVDRDRGEPPVLIRIHYRQVRAVNEDEHLASNRAHVISTHPRSSQP